MPGKIGKVGILIVLALVISLGVVVLALSYSEAGVTTEIWTEGFPIAASDLSAVPQSVVEDAIGLATELFGDYQEKGNDFANQLLALYLEAKDKDFIIVFNPGGWGWNLVETSPGWWSIFNGIKSELDSSGYTSLLLNHQRTAETSLGRLDEFVEMMALYPSKAEDLASRVEFLTSHIPDLQVIIAGESTGTVITDKVMNILKDNPQVYSIQTGAPFWHKNTMLDRTLVMTSNGIIPDSFSQGDFLTIIGANLRAFFGLSQDDSGRILKYVGAPGHDYWWQYPGVHSEIKDFLDKNFGVIR